MLVAAVVALVVAHAFFGAKPQLAERLKRVFSIPGAATYTSATTKTTDMVATTAATKAATKAATTTATITTAAITLVYV